MKQVVYRVPGYDVETLKDDIVSHVDGKILGLRREIFNEEDPKRTVPGYGLRSHLRLL